MRCQNLQDRVQCAMMFLKVTVSCIVVAALFNSSAVMALDPGRLLFGEHLHGKEAEVARQVLQCCCYLGKVLLRLAGS